MKKSYMIIGLSIVFIVAILFTCQVADCASKSVAAEGPGKSNNKALETLVSRHNAILKDRVKKRVSAYWALLVAGDSNKAFEFVEPSAQNNTNRLRFVNGMDQFDFLHYEITDIDIKTGKAIVKVKRDFKIKPGSLPVDIKGVLSQTIEDNWIEVNGEWYLVYGKPEPPISASGTKSIPPVSLRGSEEKGKGIVIPSKKGGENN